MTDALAYLCGGPLDETCLDYPSILRNKLLVNDYTWSTTKYRLTPDSFVRVWQYNKYHECRSFSIADLRVGMSGATLVEQMWQEIDAGYHKLNNDNTMTTDKVDNLKGYLRGIAWSLALFMRPHFNSADEIVAETHKRHIMATAGEPYETPGTGSLRQMTPAGSKYVQTSQAPSVLAHSFTEDQIKKIKGAMASGFEAEDLARMYNVKPDVIRGL